MSIALRPPLTQEDWIAYHDIRKRILFDARGKGDHYDATHPDETKTGNHPLLYELDGEAVGVVRIDIAPPTAWLRRMAVDVSFQHRGHGRRMIGGIVLFCRATGASQILSSVAPDAVGFYRKCGFEELAGQPGKSDLRMRYVLSTD